MVYPPRPEVGDYLRDCRDRKRVGEIRSMLLRSGHSSYFEVKFPDATTLIDKDAIHENRFAIYGFLLIKKGMRV